MKRLILTALLTAGIAISVAANEPDLLRFKQVSQLPSDLPQRVTGFAYDGQKLWTTIYLGKGAYATLDPDTLNWNSSSTPAARAVIAEVAGDFKSPGGICFVNGKLWIGGSYGGSYGSVDPNQWKVEQLFKVKQRHDRGTQSYSSLAYDGSNIWIAWHWTRYDLAQSQTQLLLKVNAATGEVVATYPAPAGTGTDLTHGLTWDGTNLWHIKDNRLSRIDPSTGFVVSTYFLPQVYRPSGLAWVNDSLWISEFYGKIWRLPFMREA